MEGRTFPINASSSTFDTLAAFIATDESPGLQQTLLDIEQPSASAPGPNVPQPGPSVVEEAPRAGSPMIVSRGSSPKQEAFSFTGAPYVFTRTSPASPKSPPAKCQKGNPLSIPEVTVSKERPSSVPRPQLRCRAFPPDAPASSSSQPISLMASTSHDARLEGQSILTAPVLRNVASYSSLGLGEPGPSSPSSFPPDPVACL